MKPPTRRQIATTVEEVVPILNAHSGHIVALKREIDDLSATLASLRGQTRWGRIRWLLGV